jgi:hypothetical protein
MVIDRISLKKTMRVPALSRALAERSSPSHDSRVRTRNGWLSHQPERSSQKRPLNRSKTKH